MSPEKMRKAAIRGILKLAPRIAKLKAQLEVLQSAEFELIKDKWAAEKELIEVQLIPTGLTKKKNETQAKSFEQQVDSMSAEKATELIAILERRINHE